MFNFCPHYSVHGVLVAKPVLPAAIHHPAVGALDHVPAQEEDRSPLWQVPCTRQHREHRELPAAILTLTRHTWQGPAMGNPWKQRFLAPR